MTRKKSRIPRAARSAALEQLRAFQSEENPDTEQSNSKPQVSNQDLLEELRLERKNKKKENKTSKRLARRSAQSLRQEEGPKAVISYANAYQPGMLVMITKRSAKRFNLEGMNLYEGACGVIVEQENGQMWRGDYEEGRWLNVMGPNGLQQWDVRWCETVDDEDMD
tara:strand:+ start:13 stop:510 length:498 start_codon:yes stop_codon:yes gene_type:complete